MTKPIIIAELCSYLKIIITRKYESVILKSVYMEGGSLDPLFIPIPSYCMFRY